MNEPWAKEVIKRGYYSFPDRGLYIVKKEPRGHCTGCAFLEEQCPANAVTICTTGGVIFEKVEK